MTLPPAGVLSGTLTFEPGPQARWTPGPRAAAPSPVLSSPASSVHSSFDSAASSHDHLDELPDAAALGPVQISPAVPAAMDPSTYLGTGAPNRPNTSEFLLAQQQQYQQPHQQATTNQRAPPAHQNQKRGVNFATHEDNPNLHLSPNTSNLGQTARPTNTMHRPIGANSAPGIIKSPLSGHPGRHFPTSFSNAPPGTLLQQQHSDSDLLPVPSFITVLSQSGMSVASHITMSPREAALAVEGPPKAVQQARPAPTSGTEVAVLLYVFSQFDEDGDDFINFEELAAALAHLGWAVSNPELNVIVAEIQEAQNVGGGGASNALDEIAGSGGRPLHGAPSNTRLGGGGRLEGRRPSARRPSMAAVLTMTYNFAFFTKVVELLQNKVRLEAFDERPEIAATHIRDSQKTRCFSPDSPLRWYWNVLVLVVTVYIVFSAGFSVNWKEFHHGVVQMDVFHFSLPFDIMAWIVMVIDFFVNLFTTYERNEEFLRVFVDDPKQLVVMRIKTPQFYFHLIAALPLFIIGAAGTPADVLQRDLGAFLNLARPFFKILRINELFTTTSGFASLTYSHVVKYFVIAPPLVNSAYLLTLVHMSAICFIYIQETPGDVLYAGAVYQSLYVISTVGSGDIKVETQSERIFLSFLVLIGMLVNAVVIGSAISFIQGGDMKSKQREKMVALDTVLNFFEIPKGLADEVRQMQNYLSFNNLLDTHQTLVKNLPDDITINLELFSKIRAISTVPFLHDAPASVKLGLAHVLRQTSATPETSLIHSGVPAEAMYFILYGFVSLYTCRGIYMSTLKEGHYLGEISLLVTDEAHVKKQSTARALTYVLLFELRKEDFDMLASEFPKFKSKLVLESQTLLAALAAEDDDDEEEDEDTEAHSRDATSGRGSPSGSGAGAASGASLDYSDEGGEAADSQLDFTVTNLNLASRSLGGRRKKKEALSDILSGLEGLDGDGTLKDMIATRKMKRTKKFGKREAVPAEHTAIPALGVISPGATPTTLRPKAVTFGSAFEEIADDPLDVLSHSGASSGANNIEILPKDPTGAKGGSPEKNNEEKRLQRMLTVVRTSRSASNSSNSSMPGLARKASTAWGSQVRVHPGTPPPAMPTSNSNLGGIITADNLLTPKSRPAPVIPGFFGFGGKAQSFHRRVSVALSATGSTGNLGRDSSMCFGQTTRQLSISSRKASVSFSPQPERTESGLYILQSNPAPGQPQELLAASGSSQHQLNQSHSFFCEAPGYPGYEMSAGQRAWSSSGNSPQTGNVTPGSPQSAGGGVYHPAPPLVSGSSASLPTANQGSQADSDDDGGDPYNAIKLLDHDGATELALTLFAELEALNEQILGSTKPREPGIVVAPSMDDIRSSSGKETALSRSGSSRNSPKERSVPPPLYGAAALAGTLPPSKRAPFSPDDDPGSPDSGEDHVNDIPTPSADRRKKERGEQQPPPPLDAVLRDESPTRPAVATPLSIGGRTPNERSPNEKRTLGWSGDQNNSSLVRATFSNESSVMESDVSPPPMPDLPPDGTSIHRPPTCHRTKGCSESSTSSADLSTDGPPDLLRTRPLPEEEFSNTI